MRSDAEDLQVQALPEPGAIKLHDTCFLCLGSFGFMVEKMMIGK
jgi:hypothetical protein